MNFYGKYLEQLRHELRMANIEKLQHQTETKQQKMLQDIYLAEFGLNRALLNGDDLKSFIGKNPDEIIRIFGKNKLVLSAPKQSVILQEIKNNMQHYLYFIENPRLLAEVIRKNRLRRVRNALLRKRKSTVLDIYANYLIATNYDLDTNKYEEAKDQQFKKLKVDEKTKMENDLYNLFEKGMLPESIMPVIEKRISTISVPSERDVIEAENTEMPGNTKEIVIPKIVQEELTEEVSDVIEKGELSKILDDMFREVDEEEAKLAKINEDKPKSDNSVYIYPVQSDQMDYRYSGYVKFSPVSYTGMFKVDNLLYPTITHFMLASLIAYLPSVSTLKNSHKYLLKNGVKYTGKFEDFEHPDIISKKYFDMRDASLVGQLHENAKIGLIEKFKNDGLRDILFATGNNSIVWGDYSDAILGSGKYKKGDNFVGKYLVEIREKYSTHRGEKINLLDGKDLFVTEWMRMRVRDIIRTAMTIREYTTLKYGAVAEFDSQFFINVINNVHHNCISIPNSETPVPRYFASLVKEDKEFGKIKSSDIVHIDEIVQLLWDKISGMVQYLITLLVKPTIQNLRIAIAQLELMVSDNKKCNDIGLETEENCIFSALINIIKGLINFNKRYGFGTEVTELDSKTAAAIILNTNIGSIRDTNFSQTEKEDMHQDGPDIFEFQYEEGAGDLDADNLSEGAEIVGYADENEGVIENEFESTMENDGYSPMSNYIAQSIKPIKEIADVEKFSTILENTIKIVKNAKMQKRTKKNRINFFATQAVVQDDLYDF